MDQQNLEARRIESEIRRLDAEHTKLLAETNEIENRNKHPMFMRRFMLQSLVGGMVAAGLLAAWAIGYLKPLLEREQALASIENDIQQAMNERQQQENAHLALLLEQREEEILSVTRLLESTEEVRMAHVETERNLRNLLNSYQSDLSNHQKSYIIIRKEQFNIEDQMLEQVTLLNSLQERLTELAEGAQSEREAELELMIERLTSEIDNLINHTPIVE
jgi:hypothetical protein